MAVTRTDTERPPALGTQLASLGAAATGGASKATPELYGSGAQVWAQTLHRVHEEMFQLLQRDGVKARVLSRLKTLESLQEKQARVPYRPDLEGAPIKDLFGLRTIVPFLQGVEEVVDALGGAWRVIEVERKSEDLSFREFAYDAVHVILDLSEYLAETELPPGVPPVAEVQVRTYLQEAWAEVEHELIYKSNFAPHHTGVRKKLAALNATLSLADSILQEVRDQQREQASWGRARFTELLKKAASASIDPTEPGVPSWIPAANADGERARTTDRSLAEALAAHNGRDYETAEQCYSQALASSADVSVRSFIYNHRGMVRFMMENARDALHDFTAAVEANPRNHSALNNRALALRRLGLVEAALDDFRSSLEIRPEQPDIHFLIGQTYFELDDPVKSRAAILRALNQDPNHPEAMALKERLGSVR